MAIYLKLEEKPKTIKDLLTKLYSNLCVESMKTIKTYSNPECTNTQCMPNRYRSLDDIVEIVNTYFPKATEKEIFLELFNLNFIIKDGKARLMPIDCDEIDKPTMFYSCNLWGKPSQTFKEGHSNSKYSWVDFFRIIGFQNTTEGLKKLYPEK